MTFMAEGKQRVTILFMLFDISSVTSLTNRRWRSGILLIMDMMSSDFTPSMMATKVPFFPLASGFDIIV